MFKNKNEDLRPLPEQGLGKKEKIAIVVGFFLIVCVFVFTAIRSFSGSKIPITDSSNAQDQIATSLGYDTVTVDDLNQLILANKQLILLDVRNFNDYIAQHIVDSVNVPAGEIPSSTKIKPSDTLYVIGSDANDGDIALAVANLKQNNFTTYKVLAGGMTAWKQKNEPTISFGDPTSFVDQAKVFYVDAQQASDMIKNDPNNVFVLDVRDQSDFAQGHVANAVNIPLLDLEKRRMEIPLMKKVLVFGVTDVGEFQAAVQIHDLRQISAYVVKGAIQGWQAAQLELVK